MSAVEIIEELGKLPSGEQERVFDYLQSKRASKPVDELRFVKDREFDNAAEKVFREHADLFKRLAQ